MKHIKILIIIIIIKDKNYVKNLRRPGIEPGSQEWESCMIPLHQRRRYVITMKKPDPELDRDYEYKVE